VPIPGVAIGRTSLRTIGDRLDNDVWPAAAAGMQAIFIRRGPWAWIQAPHDDPPVASLTIATLSELPAALEAMR
jgi:FMN phosphatase YigB (HAD superfamily)